MSGCVNCWFTEPHLFMKMNICSYECPHPGGRGACLFLSVVRESTQWVTIEFSTVSENTKKTYTPFVNTVNSQQLKKESWSFCYFLSVLFNFHFISHSYFSTGWTYVCIQINPTHTYKYHSLMSNEKQN